MKMLLLLALSGPVVYVGWNQAVHYDARTRQRLCKWHAEKKKGQKIKKQSFDGVQRFNR